MPSEQPARRVTDIINAIQRIASYIKDIGGVEALIADEYVHRDAVELEPSIDWNAIRGMGNVIRHDYDGIEDEVLHEILASELSGLSAACERLLGAWER